MKENIRQKINSVMHNIARIKNKIVYKIMKKIYDLRYRKLTYISEKGIWVSTVVFPAKVADDICGVTDIFKGDKNSVTDWLPLYTQYITDASLSGGIHRDIVGYCRTIRGRITEENIMTAR